MKVPGEQRRIGELKSVSYSSKQCGERTAFQDRFTNGIAASRDARNERLIR